MRLHANGAKSKGGKQMLGLIIVLLLVAAVVVWLALKLIGLNDSFWGAQSKRDEKRRR
jgi:flagellar basal body-associated protein FliL